MRIKSAIYFIGHGYNCGVEIKHHKCSPPPPEKREKRKTKINEKYSSPLRQLPGRGGGRSLKAPIVIKSILIVRVLS